ncbi:hypothetical protein K32_29980 [Kaistia sp. 32K]|uniref:hypothetical protein n=1 Tax=Kaistia sp. 32K TaxID=2795690 RepID=UPI001915139A|nr:hypothetical protein [Kaistia sp. 32K]BCP54381.1 hypothetical protein K32_29980 [Kaistia sp. 32K]
MLTAARLQRRRAFRRAALTLAGLLPFLAVAFSVSPARALTRQEAIVVVKLITALSPEFGKLAYDEAAADDWFEADAESDNRITRAGFTRESWRIALGATVTGYVACMPEAEFRAMLTTIRLRAENRGTLDGAQRRAMLELVDEVTVRLEAMRIEGHDHAEIVRPLASRLRRVMVD